MTNYDEIRFNFTRSGISKTFQEIRELFSNTNLAERTKNKYIGIFKTMVKKNIVEIYDVDAVFNADSGAKTTYSNGILAFFKYFNSEDDEINRVRSLYLQKHRQNTELVNERRNNAIITPHEAANTPSISELNSILSFLKNKRGSSRLDYEFYLWLFLEINLRPLRSEYLSLKIGRDQHDGFNYLDMTIKKVIFHNHKSSKYMGPVEIGFGRNIEREIKLFINTYNLRVGDFLFENNDEKKFGAQFRRNINLASCGKQIGGQIIRKVMITEWFKRPRSLNAIKKHSRECLHSLEEHLRYQRISN